MGHSLSVNFVGSCDVYHPRHPRASGYYQCVQSHFEELERLWDERYATDYGFWRPYVMEVIYRYLDCGDLQASARAIIVILDAFLD